MCRLIPAVALIALCAGCAQPPPPPPPAMISQLIASVPADNPNCREYTAPATVDGQPQQLVGRACRQADGSWRMEEGGGELPAISQVTTQVNPDNPYCRDYSAIATLNGQQQPVVGRACELADGSWQVTQGTPEQPAQVTIIYPPAPYPYPYYAYGPWPWWWGPSFVGVGGAVVFVGHRHFHDHHGHHSWGHGGGGHSSSGHHS